MPSNALTTLITALQEVRDLQRANPTPPGGLPRRPAVVRAINRSSVVLLCSHFERYLRAVNEEAVAMVNEHSLVGTRLPEILRLQHSRLAVDEIHDTQWHRRADQLASFAAKEGWLWGNSNKADLDHERLLRWMKSPSPKRVTRMFELWGISDVFGKITRRVHTRTHMWLKLTELVDKRNNIAHGDPTTEATYQDISSYLRVVRDFSSRADRALGRAVAKIVDVGSPW